MSGPIEALAERVGSRLTRHADSHTDLMRLFHGRGGAFRVLDPEARENLDSVVIDHFAGTLRVGLYAPRDEDWVRRLAVALRSAMAGSNLAGAWLQWRQDGQAAPEVLWGAPQVRVTGTEAGLRYLLHPGEGRNAGLFLDAAPARAWLRSVAGGCNVLNLFAYTCGFSLAALAGGAVEVVNMDMARGALAIGQRNHELNGLGAGARFLPHDVRKSWGALRRRGPFDVVVLDPPTFQRGSFEADRDWPRLLSRLDDLVSPGGRVLLCVNSPFLEFAAVDAWRVEHAPGFALETVLRNSGDFPELEPDRGLKVLVWRRQPAA